MRPVFGNNDRRATGTRTRRRDDRPDREATQDRRSPGSVAFELRLPPNSSHASYRNDGGPDRYSGYAYRGAADVQDYLDHGGAYRYLHARLLTSVTSFAALAERPAVWSRYTTGYATNSVSGSGTESA
jgi:hypothetical protein